MSQSDYRVISLPEPINVHHVDTKAKIIGLVVDRTLEENFILKGAIVSQPNQSLTIHNPKWWLVDEDT